MLVHRKTVWILICFSILIYYGIFHIFGKPEKVSISISSSSRPLILLYTFNKSVKTRTNICGGLRNGGHVVNFDHCPLQCEFSCRVEDFHRRSPAALLFFSEDFYWTFSLNDRNRTSLKQRWIFWSWEAPIHHSEYVNSGLTFNWTMTYRQDSDIVHDYGRFVPRSRSSTIRDHQAIDFYLSSKDNRSTFDVQREFHQRKNAILWFVSNCQARSQRYLVAQQLKSVFPVDQFGRCSSSTNNKTNRISTTDFEKLLFQYKFYLAFENAQCQDYITEKVFYNSFAHGSIPIVLGTTLNNYQQRLPSKSFLHVQQFENLRQLSEELKRITLSLETFHSYHRWRDEYRLITWPSNYYIDDRFCDLCMKLHQDHQEKIYGNFSQWLNRC